MLVKIIKPVYKNGQMILVPNQVVRAEVEVGSDLIVMPTNGVIKARRVAKSHVAWLSDNMEAMYAQNQGY